MANLCNKISQKIPVNNSKHQIPQNIEEQELKQFPENDLKTEFNKIDSEYKISQYIKDYKEKLFDKDCYQNNELKNLYIPIKSEIIQKVLESFPEDEEEENKTVGELLKSIGIIARKYMIY